MKCMKNRLYTALGVAALLMYFIPLTWAGGMQSDHFAISKSVFSNGGKDMGSEHFYIRSSLGQPSPVQSSASAHYKLMPGFWVAAPALGCAWDFEPDGDVDGVDLQWFFINGMGPGSIDPSDLESFANEFGKTDCLH